MRGFSKAIIAGNLTRDPEMRSTPSGASVCSFSVAVNRSYRDSSGNQRDEVSYIDCDAWGKTGETISRYLHRGSPILVSGRLQQRRWDDKNTGAKRSATEIVVEDFTFIGGDRNNSDSGSSYDGYNSGNYSNNNYNGSYGNSGTSAPSNAANTASKATSTIPDDIPDGEISLDEVPFDVPADNATEVSPEDIPF